jgi:RNA polymerase sigma-70 factor (ECF subfamily)
VRIEQKNPIKEPSVPQYPKDRNVALLKVITLEVILRFYEERIRELQSWLVALQTMRAKPAPRQIQDQLEALLQSVIASNHRTALIKEDRDREAVTCRAEMVGPQRTLAASFQRLDELGETGANDARRTEILIECAKGIVGVIRAGLRPLYRLRQGSEYGQPIDGFAATVIRRKARQLVGRAGFNKCDEEDLEQQLRAEVLLSLPKFDPDRAHFHAFVATVVDRKAANLLRDNQAEMRDPRRISSLNVTGDVDGEGPIELAGTISQCEYDHRRCRHSRGAEEQAELASDLAELMAKLPDDLRQLAEWLLKGSSMSEIARRTAVPRTTLNDRLWHLRRRWEDTGLKDYLR